MPFFFLLVSLGATTSSSTTEIALVDFKGSDPAVTHAWAPKNDPVMGGQSYSTVKVENEVLNFTGKCAIVPSLQAPGFITAQNTDSSDWVDVSSCQGLKITSKSYISYTGFRISFGSAHPKGGKFFAFGYKANFQPPTGRIGSVYVPFSNFTDFWDDATGDPIYTCQQHTEYCPDVKTLENMKTMSIWAEGVEGNVHLEVSSIAGYECTAPEVEK